MILSEYKKKDAGISGVLLFKDLLVRKNAVFQGVIRVN